MKKLFNFRGIVICALLVIAGIIFGLLSATKSLWLISLELIVIMVVTVLLVCNRKNKTRVISCVIAIVLTIISFCSSFFTIENNAPIGYAESCEVSGNIYSLVERKNGWTIVLQNVIINSEKTEFKLNAFVSGLDADFTEGDNVSFNSEISVVHYVDSAKQFNSNFYFNHIGYSALLDSSEIIVNSNTKSWDMVVRERVKNILFSTYSEKNAGIVFGMLFGDKSGIAESDYASFKEIGVAHIFSVSGLHISIIILLFSLLLSKLKVKRGVNFIIIFLVCLAYCVICRFSASVVRASIMSLCLIYSGFVRKQNDILNSLSLASVLILLFSPLSLFSVGFQLSFLAVLGIITLSPVLTRLISKIMPEKLASVISVSFCAQLGVMIIMMNAFGTFSLLSFACNILLIPIFSFIFSLVFVTAIFTSVFPAIGFINALPNLLIQEFVELCKFLSNSNIFSLECKPVGEIVLVLFIALLFFVGNYCVLKLKKKLVVGAVLSGLMIVFSIVNIMPTKFSDNEIRIYSDNYGADCLMIFTSTNNSRLLFNENLDSDYCEFMQEICFDNNIDSLDYILCKKTALTLNEQKNLKIKYRIKDIITVENLNEFETKTVNEYTIETYSLDIKNYVFKLSYQSSAVLFVLKTLTQSQMVSVNTYVHGVNAIYSYETISNLINFNYDINLNKKVTREGGVSIIKDNLFTYPL